MSREVVVDTIDGVVIVLVIFGFLALVGFLAWLELS